LAYSVNYDTNKFSKTCILQEWKNVEVQNTHLKTFKKNGINQIEFQTHLKNGISRIELVKVIVTCNN
jgi:hypothetical protein